MLKMVVIMNYDFEYMCQGMLEFIRPTLTVRLEVCEGGRVSLGGHMGRGLLDSTLGQLG